MCLKNLCKLFPLVTALMFSTTLFAKSLQIGGVTVTKSNAAKVIDGVAYDAATNTLTLTMFTPTFDMPFIQVSNENSDISIDENRPLIIKGGEHTNLIWASDAKNTIISYDGEVIMAGSCSFSITGGVKCSKFTVIDGTAVKIWGDQETLLDVDKLKVDNSYLNVYNKKTFSISEKKAPIRDDLSQCTLKGVYSNSVLLDTIIKETRKRKVDLGTSVTNNGSFISVRPHYYYETYTVEVPFHGWFIVTSGGGWYKSENIEIAPTAYPIWVNGVEVNRYNYNNVLKDGTVRYDPASKKLTATSEVEIKYEGYLLVEDKDGNLKSLRPENSNSGLTINEPKKPTYEPSFEGTSNGMRIQFISTDSYYEITASGEYTFPALLDGKIIYDDDKKELTFDNIVLDEGYQIIIRDGAELTINLVGENHVRLNYPEDITIYKMGHVRIKGGGSLKAQEIYFVKSDSLTIEDGCDIELQNLAGHGIVTIDNSTVTLLGDSIGTVYGFYEFNLKNCTVETPSSIFYNSINEVFEDYTSQWGYLSDKENSFPISGTVRITPSPTNGLPTIINKTTGKPNAPKYDLLGRPILNDDSKGIYIQDGRKFMNIRR